jgi:hypothetical protein
MLSLRYKPTPPPALHVLAFKMVVYPEIERLSLSDIAQVSVIAITVGLSTSQLSSVMMLSILFDKLRAFICINIWVAFDARSEVVALNLPVS